MSLAWVYRVNTGQGFGPAIKGTPVMINGILYFTVPDHVWAIDARSGREIWHHAWDSKGGVHIGNRGVGILNDTLYFETPDCHLVALNVQRRQGEVAQDDLRSRSLLLRVGRAGDREEPRDRRRQRRRSRRARLSSRRTIR